MGPPATHGSGGPRRARRRPRGRAGARHRARRRVGRVGVGGRRPRHPVVGPAGGCGALRPHQRRPRADRRRHGRRGGRRGRARAGQGSGGPGRCGRPGAARRAQPGRHPRRGARLRPGLRIEAPRHPRPRHGRPGRRLPRPRDGAGALGRACCGPRARPGPHAQPRPRRVGHGPVRRRSGARRAPARPPGVRADRRGGRGRSTRHRPRHRGVGRRRPAPSSTDRSASVTEFVVEQVAASVRADVGRLA